MIVAFGGIKRSGKDSLANFVSKRYKFEKRAFADPIKKALEIIFDWGPEVWEDDELKETVDPRWGISPRQASQHLGTEWAQLGLTQSYPMFKEITGKELWVRRTFYDYEESKNLVISDLRFVHEAHAVKERGGHLVLVYGRGISQDGHASETSVKDIQPDYTVDNSGSWAESFKQVEKIMTDILLGEITRSTQ